jgi:hypothetical protein
VRASFSIPEILWLKVDAPFLLGPLPAQRNIVPIDVKMPLSLAMRQMASAPAMRRANVFEVGR